MIKSRTIDSNAWPALAKGVNISYISYMTTQIRKSTGYSSWN
jgi:hypothetical protein